MNNIEDDAKAAIEEFGELAYERFIIDRSLRLVGFFGFYSPVSNDELKNNLGLELKPLPELFANDVKLYNDNAYFMWETKLNYDNPAHDEYQWSTASSNNFIYQALQSTGVSVRRKTSAGLPFDLELAMAGDVVEVLNPDGLWVSCKYLYEYTDKRIVMMIGTLSEIVKREDLRMKYPKKVQFGD